VSGITEVQIIQWYVEEGARVEEWKPLCQYQSDKAVDDVSVLYRQVAGEPAAHAWFLDHIEVRRSNQEAPFPGRRHGAHRKGSVFSSSGLLELEAN
jgi:hypothetical protein